MILFPTGIKLTTNEMSSLQHVASDYETWLTAAITEKARLRRDALIQEWRPILYADSSVTELPADKHQLCALIMARDDYNTRLQQDAAQDPPVPTSKTSTVIYAGTTREGSTVTLFADGLNLADVAANCVLAYIQNLEEWVIGALMGQVNRGKKKMISKYHPIIVDDPSVTVMPATEDGLITMILARSDYQRLGG